MPYWLYLCLAHSIPSPPSLMQHMHQPYHKMIWSTSYHPCWFIDLDLTCFSPLPSSIGAKSCTSFTATRSIAPKPPTCPSCLQPVHQAKSCLDLLHLSHMTACRVSCNELLHYKCEPCNKSKSSSLSWHVLLTHMYLWTNHLCISLKHILVHLRLSFNYQNQTRTFQSSPFW